MFTWGTSRFRKTVRGVGVQRLIVYIDGFNLYHGIHDWAGRKKLWLDVVALAKSLRPASQLISVRYFTAPVLDQPEAASRQSTYLDALMARSPGVLTIIQGRYQRKEILCRGCGRARPHYEEKETDVNIAVSIVEDAAMAASDAALVISADSDLIPAVKTARRLNSSLFIAAAFPPERYSAHLQRLMPASFLISRTKINQAQMPPVVIEPSTGRRLKRPSKWYS
ncbi:NYN domain-containing protein [Nakamurella sp.]|uniref:NYN domain-containing protein n=1 Tax=Nakamurella sp. TaxID=1869182 RepID=UPI003B3AF22D